MATKPVNPYPAETEAHAAWEAGYGSGHDYAKAQIIEAVRSREFASEMMTALSPFIRAPQRRREMSVWEMLKPW